MGQCIIKSPVLFMKMLQQNPEWNSLETAKCLDSIDPLGFTQSQFEITNVIPFAGHSLGPLFKPARDKINAILAFQQKLHEGHFADTHPEGKESGHWFECDRHQPSLAAAKNLLGFKNDNEFIFESGGLSKNLGMLIQNFYRPLKRDKRKGKTKILMLETEFFSDQALIHSILQRETKKSSPDALIIKIRPDENGLYKTDDIINIVMANADQLQMICLSEIVFSTGQRLELNKIFSALEKVISGKRIIVGLDLAHSVGNRPIDLKSLPVTFAVGCGYKHLSGPAGSHFGFYVSEKANLKKYPPIQGWKAADSKKVFTTINRYNKDIMAKSGAVAFRTSNPSPISLAPVQAYLCFFNNMGFDKFFNKSECMTRYLLALMENRLGDQIKLITPRDSEQRGAMLVFQVKGREAVNGLADFLKEGMPELGCYEVDVRPPNNIRITPHYGYTRFQDVHGLVNKMEAALKQKLKPFPK